jgi:integrase
MKNRVTTLRRMRATTPEGPHQPARGFDTGSSVRTLSPDSPPLNPPAVDLRRAVHHWLADGKAQGWSGRTLTDRLQAMERFCWWLENEAEAQASLAALTPATIRAFLAYAREPRPEGRYGSDKPSAKRKARPATVNGYFRTLRAFSNFCLHQAAEAGEAAWLIRSTDRNRRMPGKKSHRGRRRARL